MAGFIEGVDRGQLSLLPESLDQWVEESNPVRVIDAFVEQLDLEELGFKLAAPADLGRPGYNPALHLKLYIYGYSTAFNRAGGSSASASAISR